MSPRKIIASILIAILGSLVFASGIAWAHHPGEPCTTDAAVIASGALPECKESPEFEQHNETNATKDESAGGRTGVLIATGVGTVFFVVCILFFFRFFAKLKP